jgi:hypothetical protein
MPVDIGNPSRQIEVLIDDISGDLSENMFVPPMIAKNAYPNRRVNRWVISQAATFKKPRMDCTLKVLGSLSLRTFIVAYSPAIHFANGDAAVGGEQAVLAQMREPEDPLALQPAFENKRRARLAADPRGLDGRFTSLRRRFPKTFFALDKMRVAGASKGELLDQFRLAYEQEVIAQIGSEDPINALVVCLQGPFYQGSFVTEYPSDAGLYGEHLLSVAAEARRWRANVLILSGGYTRPGIPVSEAASTAAWLEELGVLPIAHCDGESS